MILIQTKTGKSITLNKGDKIVYDNGMMGETEGYLQSDKIEMFNNKSLIAVSPTKSGEDTIYILISSVIDKIIEAVKPAFKDIVFNLLKKVFKKIFP